MGKLENLTAEERAESRDRWAAAERRLAERKANAGPPPEPPARQVAVRPGFDQEHCDGCSAMFARGTLRPVGIGDRWRTLCRPCVEAER